MTATIRPLAPGETALMETFLYEAIHVPPGAEPPPRDSVYAPELYAYVKDFGKPSDACVVAEKDGRVVGMAWARVLPGGYGHIDMDTPELAIAVLPEYRGKGIGASLLESLFEAIAGKGFRQTSLSVQKQNPALRLYERLGYQTVRENDADLIMARALEGCRVVAENKTSPRTSGIGCKATQPG